MLTLGNEKRELGKMAYIVFETLFSMTLLYLGRANEFVLRSTYATFKSTSRTTTEIKQINNLKNKTTCQKQVKTFSETREVKSEK